MSAMTNHTFSQDETIPSRERRFNLLTLPIGCRALASVILRSE